MKRSKKACALIIGFILGCAFSATAQQEYGGTVTDIVSGLPVAGVLVSVGHSEYYTRTDANGRFALSAPTSINSAPSFSKAAAVKARWNFRGRTLDLRSAPGVNSASIYTLSGKRAFGGKVPPSRIVALPSLAKGTYLLELRGDDGLRGKARVVVSNQSAASFTVSSVTLSGNVPRLAKSAQTFASSDKLIFRHDSYYPHDVAAPTAVTNVSLVPDARSFVFDQSEIRDYRFTLSPSDLTTLDTRGYKEEYVRADLTFEDSAYGTVGLRYKGSGYTLPRCFFPNGDTTKGPPNKTCAKISYKVKFHEYNKETRFYGMKKLDLHALTADPTKMHDMLAYGLFRDMGVHAPRTSYANVYVNGKHMGLFLAVEEPDGRFTKSRWPEYGNGNLYKEKWPTSGTADHYLEGLKTNDDPADNPNVQKMISYYNAIAASNEQNFAQTLSSYMDFDYFLRYMAVDVALKNWDGVRSWYSDRTAQLWAVNHNYYFYEEENPDGKIWLIPWDMDQTFSAWGPDPYYEQAGVPNWNVTPANCNGHPVNSGNDYVRPPNCDKLTKMMAAVFWDRFVKLGGQFLNELFASQRLNAKIETYQRLISAHVDRDQNINSNDWTRYVNQLKSDLPSLAAKFSEHLRSGNQTVIPPVTPPVTPPSGEANPNGRYISATLLNNFEVTPPSGGMSWVEKYFSPNSEGSAVYNTATPLDGAADIRFNVTFRKTDEQGEYDVWSNFQLGFDPSPANLSNLKEIRIDMRCDKIRSVRVALNNYKLYQEHGADSEYGWDAIQVTDEKRRVVLKMSELAYPSWANVTPNIKETLLKSVQTLMFLPNPTWGANGSLATDPEIGYLQIDNIQFVY